MNRRRFLQAGAAGLAPAVLRGQTRRPNILFILADDLGWGDLSCYGNRRTTTPNLDRLAAGGALFTHFYVGGSVCSPSRTAFTTGHFPARHRVHGHFADEELNKRRGMPNFLDPAVPTLPRLLRDAGYRTSHVGKWHLGHGAGAPLPDAYGFTHHMSVTSNETRMKENGPGFRAQSTRVFVDETLGFVEKDRSTPFYANLWTLLPHATLDPTDEQLEPFRKLSPVPGKHAGAEAVYNASLRDLDTQLGRLFDGLEKMGVAQDTIVLFSSDNGPEDIHIRNANHAAFGSPGPFRGRKRSLYEGGVRLPFLARWPGRIRAGRVDDSSVLSAVDFLPTFAKIGGAAVPSSHQLDGEDVGDILTGAPRARRTPLMWEWRFNIAGYYQNKSPMLSIREGNWKLLLNPDGSRTELYDIPKDPGEAVNLAERHPEVVKRLAAKVTAWQKTLPEGPMDPGVGSLAYPWPKAK